MEKAFKARLFTDHYVLLDAIGAGGMAELYVATTADAKSVLAIKKLLPRYASNPRFVDLLVAEAKVCSLLEHPNIVKIFDLGAAGSDFYIAMEFVSGKSLDRMLEKLLQTRKRMPGTIAMGILAQIANGLDHAHQARDGSGRELKLIHRDITPGNILTGYAGEVRLTDFGIVTAARDKMGGEPLALGKLPYMAPEQVRNQSLDHRADLYALAAVGFEMLTGRKPFQAENEIMLQEQILRADVPSIRKLAPELPEPVEQLFKDFLAKEIGRRPNSGAEMVEKLKPYLNPASPEQIGKFVKSHFTAEAAAEAARLQAAQQKAPEIFAAAGRERAAAAAARSAKDAAGDSERTVFIAADEGQQATSFIPKGSKKPTVERAATNDEMMSELMQESGPSWGFDPEANQGKGELFADQLEAAQAATTFEPREDAPKPAAPNPAAADIAVVGKIKLASRKQQREEFFEQFQSSVTPAPQPQAAAPAAIPQQSPQFSEDEVSLELAEPAPLAVAAPAAKRAVAMRPQPEEVAPPKPRGRFGALFVFLGLVVALIGAAFYVWEYHPELLLPKPSGETAHTIWRQPEVTLYLFAEKPQTAKEEKMLNRFLAPVSIASGSSLYSLPEFFNTEYSRLTGKRDFKLNLHVEGPLFVSAAAPQKTPWYRRAQTYDYFDSQWAFAKKADSKPSGEATNTSQRLKISIYFYRMELGGKRRYPLEYFGYRRPYEGVVFLPIERESMEFSIVNVVHEMLHLLGATDKFNEYGQPLFPGGFADPQLQPLYPQKFAEVMARTLPVGNDQTQPISLLSQVRIGQQTAREIGWLDAP